MFGLGGALVYTPLFILLGYNVHLSIATALLINGIATLSAAFYY